MWRLEFKRRKSGENAGKLAPHFHWLLRNVPWEFPLRTERGEWAALRRTKPDGWELRLRCRDGDEVRTVTVPEVGQDEITFWFSRNWYDVAGTGDVRHFRAGTNVKRLGSAKEVFCYVAKYLGKVETETVCQYPGRFWGVVNPQNIPLGKRVVLPCTGRPAAQVIRFLRRFMRSASSRKVRTNEWSSSCICAADFWAVRMLRLLEIGPPQERLRHGLPTPRARANAARRVPRAIPPR